MNAIGFIFARGGSKGLPGKNIRPLAGKPLIAWSIEQAMSVSRIQRVIVSTDSAEIAAVAKAYGAEVPFLRPVDLAKDDSPERLAWRHALNYLRDVEGVAADVMVSIPATAPLRFSIDIENCMDEYRKGNVEMVVTVTDPHRNPYFNMVTAQADGSVRLVIEPASGVTRRQDAPAVFDMATVCYVANTDYVLNCDATFDGRIRAVHVPIERSIDIDTLLDFEIADFLMQKRISASYKGA